MSTQTMFKTC